MKRFIAAMLCILLCCALMPELYVFASLPEAEKPSTASSSDAKTPAAQGDFIRVAMIPLNVDIPYFYQEVTNVSGMYIFTLPDGTVYKRIYGSLDGVFGWYIPNSANNTVATGAQMADIKSDTELYKKAVAEAELYEKNDPLNRQGVDLQDYAGILPPETGVVSLPLLFGVPLVRLALYILAAVVVLCLIILLARRKRSSKGESSEPKKIYYIDRY